MKAVETCFLRMNVKDNGELLVLIECVTMSFFLDRNRRTGKSRGRFLSWTEITEQGSQEDDVSERRTLVLCFSRIKVRVVDIHLIGPDTPSNFGAQSCITQPKPTITETDSNFKLSGQLSLKLQNDPKAPIMSNKYLDLKIL
ncbi:hypothetical protein YC2023_037433 [Brassica napus]